MNSTTDLKSSPRNRVSAKATSSACPSVTSYSITQTLSSDGNRRYTSKNAMMRLSELLGHKVSKSSFWRWVTRRDNPLPSHKPAGRLIFIESELVRWANTPRKQPSII